MRKAIVLDCDSVVLDYHKAFVPWGAAMVGREIVAHHSESLCANFPDKDELISLVKLFKHRPEFAALEAMPGARLGVEYVHTAFSPEWEIICATACGVEADVKLARERNFLELDIERFFDRIVHVPLGGSKIDIFREYDRTIILDDSPDPLIESASLHSSTPIAFTRPYNKHLLNFHRAGSWSEAVMVITDLAQPAVSQRKSA